MPENTRTQNQQEATPKAAPVNESRVETPVVDTSTNTASQAEFRQDINTLTGDAAAAPVNDTPENTSQYTSETNSAGMSAPASEKPKEETTQKVLSIEELQAKRTRGLLTLDEAQRLNDAENAKAPTSVKRIDDPNAALKDPEKEKFEEMDVIDYMYKHWLIDGVMVVDQKVRKYAMYGFERMVNAVNQHNAERKAEQEKIEGSSTYKATKNIKDQMKERNARVLERSKQKKEDIFRVSQVIQSGTLFNPENKELLEKFDQIVKADTPDGKSLKEKLEESSKKLNADPDSKEQQQEMKKLAAEFSRDAGINEKFDTSIELAANKQTAAQMLDEIARDKNAIPNDIEAAFESRAATNADILQTATAADRKNALETIDEVDRKSAAMIHAGMGGAQAAMMLNKEWEDKSFGTFDKINEQADKAIKHTSEDINDGRFNELESEPTENKALNELHKTIAEKLPEGQKIQRENNEQENQSEAKTPEPRYTKPAVKEAMAEKEAEEPTKGNTEKTAPDNVKKDEKPATLEDEAKQQGNTDTKNQQKLNESTDRMQDLAAREQQHEQHGREIGDRIARMKARAQKSIEAKQSVSDYMLDSMIAEGDLNKAQRKSMSKAINSTEGSGATKEERVLDSMIKSGKFTDKQLNTALDAAIARQQMKNKARD